MNFISDILHIFHLFILIQFLYQIFYIGFQQDYLFLSSYY